MSAEHTYKFNVSMSCGGCSGAVNRVLGKLEGTLSFPSSPHPLIPSIPSPVFLRQSPLPTPPRCADWLTIMRFAGVKSYDVSLDTQTATVVAAPELSYETVLKTIKKTGKKVNSGEADGEEKSIEVPEE
jgi:copper chaperone